MASIFELSVGKILTVYHHGIEEKFHYVGFEINSERDIKSILQISSLMRSLEKFWKACNKIQIRVEALFVLYTKYLVTQNISCVAHSAICAGFKEEENE